MGHALRCLVVCLVTALSMPRVLAERHRFILCCTEGREKAVRASVQGNSEASYGASVKECLTTDELRCWRRECGHGQ